MHYFSGLFSPVIWCVSRPSSTESDLIFGLGPYQYGVAFFPFSVTWYEGQPFIGPLGLPAIRAYIPRLPRAWSFTTFRNWHSNAGYVCPSFRVLPINACTHFCVRFFIVLRMHPLVEICLYILSVSYHAICTRCAPSYNYRLPFILYMRNYHVFNDMPIYQLTIM